MFGYLWYINQMLTLLSTCIGCRTVQLISLFVIAKNSVHYHYGEAKYIYVQTQKAGVTAG